MLAATLGIIGLMIVQTGQFGDDFWQREDPDWQLYKTLFISEHGRVIDTGNQNNSHSEGQGWGMFFAVKYNDQPTFERLWKWTRDNLQLRQDRLFIWRWEANQPVVPIPDTNNATDGDLYIAWALLRAGKQWKKPQYSVAAKEILQQTRELMTRQYAGMTILLPGGEGFEREDHLLLNLSYWIFPAFNEFNQIDPSPVWNELHKSGLKLIEQTRFGKWKLPPDWITLSPTGEIELSSDFPPRFSYDAIRVPLSLLWAEVSDQQLLKPYKNLSDHFSTQQKTTPAWVNLEDGSVASYQASDGFNGIMALVSSTAFQNDKQTLLTIPHVTEEQDYYSASLIMLTRQAMEEIKER